MYVYMYKCSLPLHSRLCLSLVWFFNRSAFCLYVFIKVDIIEFLSYVMDWHYVVCTLCYYSTLCRQCESRVGIELSMCIPFASEGGQYFEIH